MVDIRRPTELDPGIRDRLASATVAHRDALEVAQRAAKVWKETVVEAMDAGMSYATCAELAGVSRARIHHIVAAHG